MDNHTNPSTAIDWQARLSSKRSQKFTELYGAQEAALDTYINHFLDKSSIAVELPTGSGKTLIALMILDYWMEQKRRVAVLCGTKNLARQFKSEADALGVPAILFEGSKTNWSTANKFTYSRGKSIAILNYWGYINQGPGIDPADILILDDAHLAENAAHDLFSLEISRSDNKSLYGEIINGLASRFPHYSKIVEYQQASQSSFSAIELVNFTDWLDLLPHFESIMDNSPDCKKAGSLYFEWKRIRQSLSSILCFVGPNAVTIRPGCYPLFKEDHIKKPQQRIMLSATIGSVDDLSRRIGIPKIDNLPIAPKFRLAVPGKRLLLFPDNEKRESNMVALALEAAMKLKRSVWLCDSSNEIRFWSNRLQDHLQDKGIGDQPLFIAMKQAEEIDQFIEAPAGHLFTAARYDGMDFEGNTSRLVVMPSLPRAVGAFERFVSENLADASFLNFRVLQRMKQALGRATRNDHDYAIYIFLKNAISQYLTSSDSFDQFPSNVQDEIEFGADVSARNLGEISRICNSFLRGQLGEIQFPQNPIQYPQEESKEVTTLADIELDFWAKIFKVHNFDQAAIDAEKLAFALERNKQPGYALFWRYLKALASYLRYKHDHDAAGLASARNEIARILNEPRQSAWFSRLNRLRQTLAIETVIEEADTEEFDLLSSAWNNLLDSDLRNSSKHEQFFGAVIEGLVGSDHQDFCHAMRNFLRLLGWQSEVKGKGEGDTDVIATVYLKGQYYLIIVEGKPEMEVGKALPLRYVNQASGQLARYSSLSEFKNHKAAAILVSKADQLDPIAELAAGNLTFIRQTALKPIAEMAISAFRRYADIRYRKGLLPKRSESQEALNLSPKVLGIFEVCAEKGKILENTKVLKEVKR